MHFIVLDEGSYEFYLSHSFELFNNFIETGNFQASTAKEVSKMLYLPSAHHFMFGAGFVGEANHGYYLPDPGVMKILLAFGVFGFIIFYSFSIYSALIFFRFFKLFNDRTIEVFVFFLLILIFSFELKEPGLYQNYNFKVFTLIVVSHLIVRGKLRGYR